MALLEKTTQEDLIFWEIFRNPVLFSEFMNNIDRTPRDEVFELVYYQKEFMMDFNNYETLCCSRAVGKTVGIRELILWALVYNLFPNEYITYFVPGKAQLDPVWTNLIRSLRSNSLLKNFIAQNAGTNSSEFRITMLNHAALLCRIAGQSGVGINVIGLHTPMVIIDEAAYFPWNVFMEMQPIVNTFTPGYKVLTSGVPNGLRENNVLYHCDQENSYYSKHRINSFKNPRFSEKDLEFAIEQYGGKDSEDYNHFVLGVHGKPVFALFDRSLMEIGNYPVYKLKINGMDLSDNLENYFARVATIPPLPGRNNKCIMGIDLGYTEPTAIIIAYLDDHGRIKFHARIQLTKVSYPLQEKIIDRLDSKFNPSILGIDRGGVGVSVVQRLQESVDYAHKNYEKRLIPIDFSTYVILGTDGEGEEIKSKTKPFAVSVLQDYSNNHKIVYTSTDLEFIVELERMTYSKNPSGDIAYKTLTAQGGKRGDDHFTSAMLCMAMAYYLNNDYFIGNQKRKKLLGFSWLVG